jgi:hypothetical protein
LGGERLERELGLSNLLKQLLRQGFQQALISIFLHASLCQVEICSSTPTGIQIPDRERKKLKRFPSPHPSGYNYQWISYPMWECNPI